MKAANIPFSRDAGRLSPAPACSHTLKVQFEMKAAAFLVFFCRGCLKSYSACWHRTVSELLDIRMLVDFALPSACLQSHSEVQLEMKAAAFHTFFFGGCMKSYSAYMHRIMDRGERHLPSCRTPFTECMEFCTQNIHQVSTSRLHSAAHLGSSLAG